MEITFEQLDELSIESEKKNQLIRDQRQRIRELEEVAFGLAKWSLKYPRQTIYAMSQKETMDGELIALEEKAKQLLNQKQ